MSCSATFLKQALKQARETKPVRSSVKQVARRQKRVVNAAALGAMSAISVWALSSSTAQAAGYYVGEIGARSMARGGANMVNPGDPSATWLNPAAITLVSGVQLQLDGNFVQLSSEFTRDCGGVANGCAVRAATCAGCRRFGKGNWNCSAKLWRV